MTNIAQADELFTALPLTILSTIRAAGYNPDWPLWPTTVICAGHIIEPHPDSGVLVIDGEPMFSEAWR